jgi:hypothetical protein
MTDACRAKGGVICSRWRAAAVKLCGWDYNLGAVMIRAADAAGEEELLAMLQAWQLRPEQFHYSWQTSDPR